MERARLLAARMAKGWSQEYVASRLNVDRITVQRWEQNRTTPQTYHLERLCQLFGKTALELGLIEERLVMAQPAHEQEETTEDAYTSFRSAHFWLRLWHLVCNWPTSNVRYHELQEALLLELEDYHRMSREESMSRRDALRFLAAMPIEICGLSAVNVVIKRPIEEILTQCAAGITACWELKKGKDLVFISDAVAKYLTTLKEIARVAPTVQSKAAADLLAQCFLLKASLSWNVATPADGIRYAQQAETYSKMVEQPLLQVI